MRSYPGRSRLAPERATRPQGQRSEKSAEAIVAARAGEGPNDGEGETPASLGGRHATEVGQVRSAQTAGAVKPQGPRVRVEAPSAAVETSAREASDLMEQGVRTPEPSGRVEACSTECGQSRHRRDDGRRAARPSARALAAPARGAARGTLPAAAGEAGGDPEARRGRARARHPDGARPVHPAGPAAGPAAAVRPDLLGCTATASGPDEARTTRCVGRKRYVQEGRSWVVDIDLEKFFDRVNHDILMGRLAKRIADRRVLRLIRRYLNAGMLANGVVIERYEGTPQGGPLSPLLANVLLDEVDKELERRGHAFVRYADDCNVYVRTQRAGERVMRLAAQALRQAQAPGQRDQEQGGARHAAEVPRLLLLGGRRDGRSGGAWHPRPSQRMKERVRELTRRSAGRSLAQMCKPLGTYLSGWKAYFRLAETPGAFADSTSGSVTGSGRCSSSTGSEARIIYRELRARGMTDPTRPGGSRPTAAAGGTTRRWRSTWRCRTALRRAGSSPACQRNLNPSNRPVRTRMPGGVAGDAEAITSAPLCRSSPSPRWKP